MFDDFASQRFLLKNYGCLNLKIDHLEHIYTSYFHVIHIRTWIPYLIEIARAVCRRLKLIQTNLEIMTTNFI